MANEAIPFYEDGDELPCVAKGAVTGKRFVQVAAARQGTLQTSYAPPPYVPDTGLDTTASGGRIVAGLPSASGAQGAGAKCLGVASWDAPDTGEFTVLKRKILPVKCSADVVYGIEVEAATDGTVIPLASGKAVGFSVDSAVSGNDAQIYVY